MTAARPAQVGAARGELDKRGHSDGMLRIGQLPPAGMVPRFAGDLGYEYPVSVRMIIDHAF